MSRITHFKVQPKNIQYWDYYILCRLDTPAAIALQKLEYWDGTKEDGNIHAEDLNDALEAAGEEATQMISRWFYKSQDELQWELMGLTGEKGIAAITKLLLKQGYIEQRTNPDMPMDRKKQYHFNEQIIQDHINYLSFIVDYFRRAGHREEPVFYAIERLTDPDTEKGGGDLSIDELSIAHVIEKLRWLYEQTDKDEAEVKENTKYKPIVPKFIRIKLNKDRHLIPRLAKTPSLRFRNFAEWKTQFCGMDSDRLRNGFRKNAGAIAVTTNNDYEQKESKSDTPTSSNPQPHHTHASLSQEKEETQPLLTPEQQVWFENVYCKGKWWAVPPPLTKTLARHIVKFYKVVKTIEELNSYYEYVKERVKDLPNPAVCAGNLASADHLNGWKQTYQPPQPKQLVGAGASSSRAIDFHSDPWA